MSSFMPTGSKAKYGAQVPCVKCGGGRSVTARGGDGHPTNLCATCGERERRQKQEQERAGLARAMAEQKREWLATAARAQAR